MDEISIKIFIHSEARNLEDFVIRVHLFWLKRPKGVIELYDEKTEAGWRCHFSQDAPRTVKKNPTEVGGARFLLLAFDLVITTAGCQFPISIFTFRSGIHLYSKNSNTLWNFHFWVRRLGPGRGGQFHCLMSVSIVSLHQVFIHTLKIPTPIWVNILHAPSSIFPTNSIITKKISSSESPRLCLILLPSLIVNWFSSLKSPSPKKKSDQAPFHLCRHAWQA